MITETLGWFFIGLGTLFFLSGTLALLRFPDLFTRLHALTKADNLGLGLIILGLVLHSDSPAISLKLLFIWLLVLLASASVSHLIARAAYNAGQNERRRHPREHP